MPHHPDTDAMRAAAQRLNHQAEQLRAQARAVRMAVDLVRWRGPAANLFQRRVASLDSAFCITAAELDDAAGALRAHAEAVDAEIHGLRTSWLADAGFLLDPTGGLALLTAGGIVHAVEGWR